MPTLRTFIAIPLEIQIIRALQKLHQNLRSLPVDVTWISPQSIHLTLKFLGNVEESRVDDIGESIQRGIAGVKPWTIEVKKIGTFPAIRNPRVVWVGLNDPGAGLVTLQQRIEAEVTALGFEKEKRTFTPHLTLGRVRSSKGKADLAAFIIDERERSFGEMEVNRIVLYKSDLRPTGAIYTALKAFPL